MPSSTLQALEGGAKIVAVHGDESDPWARAQCRLVPRDAFVTGDQKYPHVGNVEQQGVDVDAAALRHDDLSRVTSQSERRAQRDQLRMPHGEERMPMDAAGSSKDRIGRDTRKAFINQMCVGCATAERAGIRPASIAILRLDEYQRHRRLASAWSHEAEFASIVTSTPRIADALHGVSSSRQSNAVDSRSTLAVVASTRFTRHEALKRDGVDHIHQRIGDRVEDLLC